MNYFLFLFMCQKLVQCGLLSKHKLIFLLYLQDYLSTYIQICGAKIYLFFLVILYFRIKNVGIT